MSLISNDVKIFIFFLLFLIFVIFCCLATLFYIYKFIKYIFMGYYRLIVCIPREYRLLEVTKLNCERDQKLEIMIANLCLKCQKNDNSMVCLTPCGDSSICLECYYKNILCPKCFIKSKSMIPIVEI